MGESNVWVSEKFALEAEFVSFFESIYASDSLTTIEMNKVMNLVPQKVTSSMNESLLKPFYGRRGQSSFI